MSETQQELDAHQKVFCPRCDGEGVIPNPNREDNVETVDEIECPDCKGSGKV